MMKIILIVEVGLEANACAWWSSLHCLRHDL